MNKVTLASLLAVVLLPGAAYAAGGGRATGTSPKSSTSAVTVTIPGVVGIDIESDVGFDFSVYPAATSSTVCNANEFPPSPACEIGTSPPGARYDPQITSTASLPGTAPDTGAIWMALFCSRSAGSLTINASATAFGASPGFTISNIRYQAASTAATNPAGVGPAFGSPVGFTTISTGIGNGSLGAGTFGWTRADQKIDLLVPAGAPVTDANSPYTSTITITITKA